jgi:CHASE1-domain containing sensor protein
VRQEQFERQADQIAAAIQERVESFQEVLWGAAALMGHDDDVHRDEWARYAHALGLARREPGIVALEWIAYVPRAQLAAFETWARADLGPAFKIWPADSPRNSYVVSFVEPPAAGGGGRLGRDLAADPLHREAAERARDSGEATFSAPHRLAVFNALGVDVFVPVYQGGPAPGTVAERRSRLRGWGLRADSRGEDFRALGGRDPVRVPIRRIRP